MFLLVLVCLLTGLLKKYEQVSMKFSGGVEVGTDDNLLDSGSHFEIADFHQHTTV